jgi:hypothetical protein
MRSKVCRFRESSDVGRGDDWVVNPNVSVGATSTQSTNFGHFHRYDVDATREKMRQSVDVPVVLKGFKDGMRSSTGWKLRVWNGP